MSIPQFDDDYSAWIINSLEPYSSEKTFVLAILQYIQISICGFILIHSFLIHKFDYKSSVRIQTEVASICGLLAGILILISLNDIKSKKKWAIFKDLLSEVIFTIIIILCDNYMVYYRLLALVDLSFSTKILINFYIWFLIVLPILPIKSILPLFYNLNTNDTVIYYCHILIQLSLVAYLLFNCFITIYLWFALLKLWNDINNSNIGLSDQNMGRYKITRIVVLKSFGHCCTCCSAAIIGFYGTEILIIILVLGMHLWFNVPIENWQCFEKEPLNIPEWRRVSEITVSQRISQTSYDHLKMNDICHYLMILLCLKKTKVEISPSDLVNEESVPAPFVGFSELFRVNSGIGGGIRSIISGISNDQQQPPNNDQTNIIITNDNYFRLNRLNTIVPFDNTNFNTNNS